MRQFVVGIVVAACIALAVWMLLLRGSSKEDDTVAGPGLDSDLRPTRPVDGLEDSEFVWAAVEKVWMLPTGGEGDEQLPSVWAPVSNDQIAAYAVVWFEREVLNGGFSQYLYNASVDLPWRALDGLRRMGATAYATLLQEAMAALPGGELPPTLSGRRRVLPYVVELDAIGADEAVREALDGLDDRFYELYGDGREFYRIVAAYIRAHPDAFFR